MTDPEKLIFCNIGWMERYQGRSNGDIIRHGGSNMEKHEICNFLKYRGNYYGYVQPGKGGEESRISIRRIEADAQESVSGVTVIWTAKHDEFGTVVVGWYGDAVVYGECQQYDDNAPHRRENISSYRIKAAAQNCRLLPPEKRCLQVPRGKGGMGQSNICYQINKPEFQTKLRHVLAGKEAYTVKNTPLRRNPDTEKKRAVEDAAIRSARQYYENHGYEVISVEKENKGWDLECHENGKVRFAVEVKGLSGGDIRIELTPNEFRASQRKNFRLAVVTHALEKSKSQCRVFKKGELENEWCSINDGKTLCASIVKSAIISEKLVAVRVGNAAKDAG